MAAYPPRFGPVLWSWIHLSAHRLDVMRFWYWTQLEIGQGDPTVDYPTKIESLHRFLQDIPSHVPCEACSINFTKFLSEHPLPDWKVTKETKPDPEVFWKWSVDGHNHANAITGKRIVDYPEARDMFNDQWMNLQTQQDLSVSQRQRLEDHTKMKELEAELAAWRSGARGSGNSIDEAMVIATLVLLVLFIFVIAWLVWKKFKKVSPSQE